MKKIIDFKIEHIDPLGQGVSKISDKISFISKTLPGETGKAEVFKEKSKIQFAKAISIDEKSEKRITSECPHFESCPGCHFLHTDYQSEIDFKLQSMKRLFRKWPLEIGLIPSKERIGYRNRIQLHYDLDKKLLGFIDASTKRIIEVPNCLISLPEINEKVKSLYLDNNWISFAQVLSKKRGHVELYFIDGKVQVEWNKPYASGGFSQVHGAMNQKLINLVNEKLLGSKNIWDFFGGAGNLSAKLQDSKAWVVDGLEADNHPNSDHQIFSTINLYGKNAFEKIEDQMPFEPDVLILDPPRSGFKGLSKLLQNWPAKKVLYISCHPDTMMRDINQLLEEDSTYSLDELFLLDLFPSTFHYEGAAIINKN